MKKKIIITGATGFLGSHLLRSLEKISEYELLILKRSFSNTHLIEDLLNNPKIKFFNLDETDIEDIFKEKITAIIHCATDYGRDGDCTKVLESNLIFPIKLLENAVKNKVKIFINTDSYFNKDNLSYLYLQNYSLSKKTLNLWLKEFSKKMKIINVILEHIYGENDNKNKFVYQMVEDIGIKQVQAINVTGGEQKRDFIYIEDVCEGYKYILKYALKHKFKYKTFNLGTGKAVRIKDFLNYIKKLTKSKTTINYGALAYRDDEIMISVADNIDLEDIGWKAKYDYKSGLKEMICKEVKEHGKIIKYCNTNI